MDSENGLKFEKEQADKLLLKAETVLGYISTISFLILIFLASYLEMSESLRILLITVGSIIFAIGICYALKLEQIAGYYECANCRHKYVPSYKSVFFAMHVGRTRYLKCPVCGKKSWNKKVLKK
ncbi:MAG: hypothetical protein K5768_09710 [Firmicutes bacterium]|nr:hypothetical protein [Bacillota bacterium]